MNDRELLPAIELRKLRKIRARELAVRFAFGAAASLLAGSITLVVGPRPGGVFLAFPAILVASLTLIEKKEGTSASGDHIKGTVLGAVGLAAFAIAFEAALPRTALGFALALACGAWLVTSIALYLVTELTRRFARRTPVTSACVAQRDSATPRRGGGLRACRRAQRVDD